MEGVIVRLGSDPFFWVTHSESRTAELTKAKCVEELTIS
jgi:hypothetical protein